MQPMFDRIISNKLTKTFTNRFKGSRFLCSVNDLAVAFPQNMITLESDTKTFEVNQICVDKTKFFGRGLHQVYTPVLRADAHPAMFRMVLPYLLAKHMAKRLKEQLKRSPA